MTERMRTPLVLSTFLVHLLAGCMTERARPVTAYPVVPNQSTFLVHKIMYDEHGRPLFRDRLSRRPDSAGERFNLVHAVDNRPSRSYDIVIVEQPKTGPGPMAVIYEWTGKGFEGGLAITSDLVTHGATISSREEAAVYLALTIAPVAIATVTGFVVGVIASIPETTTELKRVIINTRETLIGYTDYVYDEQGRIRFTKLYPPVERAEPLVRTEFFYEGGGDASARTEVTSMAETKVRVVR